MIKEGFYKLELHATGLEHGIAIVDGGKIHGGNRRYFYSGNVSSNAQNLTAVIKVWTLSDKVQSVSTIYELCVTGVVTGNGFQFSGPLPSSGAQIATIIGTWVTDLNFENSFQCR